MPVMRKIMIYDDEYEMIDLLLRALHKEYFVEGYTETDHICQQVENSRPDVILIDYFIGNHNATRAIQSLKSNPDTAMIPILLFSGYEKIEQVAELAPVEGYIRKPFSLIKLRESIAAAINMPVS